MRGVRYSILVCAAIFAAHAQSPPPVFPKPDVILTNQRGEPVQVYTDLIQGHTVVINTIFTTCTTICPVMGATFARLAKILHERGADEVRLISISVDPRMDTPARLTEWSRHFGDVPQWTLLTGDATNVQVLLKAVRASTADKRDHTPDVLIGNEASGDWTSASGLAPAARLAEIVLSKVPVQRPVPHAR